MSGIVDYVAGAKSRIPVPTAAAPHDAFVVGVDLGQAADYSALCVIEKLKIDNSEIRQQGFEAPTVVGGTKRVCHLRHLQRLKLGTEYPEVVEIVGTLMKALPPAKVAPALVVDATMVGRPVVDMMVKAGLRPIAVTITGGNAENYAGSNWWNIPKRNLVSTLAVLMQSGRLKVSPELVEAETFVNELANFKVKISSTGHDSYNSWRESIHDDLVLSVALAAWWCERPALPRVNFTMDR
jgi:hypothetical protein